MASHPSPLPHAVALGPNRVTFLLSAAATGGVLSLTEFAAAPPPAPAAPIHRHLDADETLYILAGNFEFVIGDRREPAPTGASIFIPRGTPHTIENVGPGTGRMLIILTPPGFEQFWAERARYLAEHGGPEDAAALLTLQEKYHMDTGGRIRDFDQR